MSPIIAVILLVAIVVIMAPIVMILANRLQSSQTGSPASAVLDPTEDGSNLRIRHVAGDPLDPAEIQFSLTIDGAETKLAGTEFSSDYQYDRTDRWEPGEIICATCRYVQANVTRLFVASSSGISAEWSGELEVENPAGQARWDTALDWDAATDASGTVHADVGDRSAGTLTIGYPSGDSGLVAYWPFDEDSGSTAGDATDTGADGSIEGATPGSTGMLGSTAYDFDGEDDYVEIPDTAALGITQGSWGGWVRADQWAHGSTARDYWFDGRDHRYMLFTDTADSGSVYASVGGSWATPGFDPPSTSAWHHLMATFDGSSVKVYVDGSEVSSAAASGDMDTSAGIARIGDYIGDTDGRYAADGRIDEVVVYDRALSASEVSSIHDRATGGTAHLVTGWKSVDTPLTAGDVVLTDVAATLDGETIDVIVQSDTDGDGTTDETASAVTLASGNTGPYDVTGLTTDADRVRLRIEMSTSTPTKAPELDGITVTT